ncbi:hypothetical protein [Pseudoalteromonas rubra]|uniref:hypothetical protein n=1 Tax=Pseudoalteromonas rubra TaxID=43658 RepID=UPI0012DC203A|nr:hypothetical protein [Pseudoalteromonas rubra]
MLDEKVMIHGQVWLCSDIEKEVSWCKALVWDYQQYRKENDHEHCAICYWTIFKTHDVASGFAYSANGHWICQECFDYFIK